MKNLFRSLTLSVAVLAAVAALQPLTMQAAFNVSTATTTAQTHSSGAGVVTSTGAITVNSNGTNNVITMSGTGTTVDNSGTIQQDGSGRAINANGTGLQITNQSGALIQSTSSDGIQASGASTSLTIINSGTIQVTAGGQALDLASITSGANTITNNVTGVISAVGEDAVRPGANGIVNNAGSITATPTGTTSPTGSDGIQANNSGVNVTNSGTISGRHGITGGTTTFAITVTNNAGTISGVNGSGVNIDGVATTSTATVTNANGATIRGGVLSAATNGDGDGVDVDGVLTLNNSGDILGYGAKGVGSDTFPNNPEGVAAGGGTIINTATGRIIGSTLAADAPNGDTTREGHGILVDNSSGGNAIAATSITNSGLIQGKTGYGIRIIGTFADDITNNASGTIRGAGTGAAIQTGDGADTLTNRGIITGDNGSAIDLEAGNDTLTVEGNSAVITGTITGGSGTNALILKPGTGNSFSHGTVISNFATVEVDGGTVTLSAANTGIGATTVTSGTFLATNSTGSALGTGTVTVKSGATLGGTGFLAGAVTVESGGKIAPGTSPGTLNLEGGLSLTGGSRFVMELGANPATSDLLAITGALDFTGSGQALVDITNTGMVPGLYTLITFTGSTTLDLAEIALGNVPTGFVGTLSVNSNNVQLNVQTVPEPSSLALLLTATGGWLLWRRRNS